MGYLKKYFLVALCCQLFSFLIEAQNPYAININMQNGLPSNEVYHIFQDTKGYIWVAHNEGLSRYDGYAFTNFHNKSQTSKAGTSIQEDKMGRIWYQNFDGYLYYVEKDSLHSLKQNTPPGFLNYGIIHNHLYVIQNKGIDIYDLANLKLIKTIYFDKVGLTVSHYTKENFFFYNKNGLFKIDDRLFQIQKIPQINKKQELSSTYLFSNSKKMILYTNNKADKYCYATTDSNYSSFFYHGIEDFIQAAIYTDQKYWLCTSKGVHAYNEKGEALNHNKAYFENASISSVLKDREGNHWLSTLNQGLLFVPDMSSKLLKSNFKIKKIKCINNKIVCGTENGAILELDPISGETKTLAKNEDNKSIDFLEFDEEKNKIYYTTTNFIHYDLASGIKKKYGIAVKDIHKISDKYYAYAASGVCGLFPINAAVDSIWDNSIINKNTGNTIWPEASQSISKVRGKSIAFNSKTKTIYFATHINLFAVNKNTIKILNYNQKNLYIKRLQQYNDNIYALNTQGALFQIFDDYKIKPITLNTYSEILNIKNFKIVKHYLFITTISGLYYFDLLDKAKTRIQLNLGPQNELSDIDIIGDQIAILNGGELFLTKLITDKKLMVTPKLHIKSLRVNQKEYQLKPEQKFDYNQNNVDIQISILSFNTGSKFPLYYKINNSNWLLLAPESRILQLPLLAPNKYNIQFKLGSINDNSYRVTSLTFEIMKPWWLSIGAYFSYAIISILLLFIIYDWRMRQLKHKNAMLEEKIILEKNLRNYTLKSIKAQMNPHFFYNALNTIQSFIFENDKRNASTYLSKFSKLTRTILEMSEKETVSLLEEIEALKLYLDIEKVRFNKDFEYQIELDPNIDLEFIKIPSMLIQPYVENAVKHGLLHKNHQKLLNLRFKKNNMHLEIQIEDNGIGRVKSMALNKIKDSNHKSFATEANLKRLNVLNAENITVVVEYIDKQDLNGIASGTIVTIRIPTV